MKKENQFYIIDREVLPEVFLKVMEVKELLEQDKQLTVQEATETVGISRSSFYKYKDAIMPYFEKNMGKTITILIQIKDEIGKLTDILNYIACIGGNILTINQMIPINGVVLVSICVQTTSITIKSEELISQMRVINGVEDVKILATD